jgi:prepilin-type N-terminal cleavage/methylation domain-containing protein/prepilin-type processing-associated H-X9-DG protein
MSKRKAFTLVELLVVIGIIAVLIAILMPALAAARESAQSVNCLSNQRQLGIGLVMFTQEHGGYLVKPWFNDGPKAGHGGWHYRDPMLGWTYLLIKYVGGNKAVYRCPADDSNNLYDTDNDTMANLPDRPDADNIPDSYRLNSSDLPNGPFDAIKMAQLPHPEASIMVAEARIGFENEGWNQLSTWEAPPGLVRKDFKDNVASDRHRHRANYMFADGHAESLLWDDTWQPAGKTAQGRTITMWRHLFNGWGDR